jgi:NAD(P)-dependent dehydrogenase (short-subunit alcohol dehydrogenase family)
VSVSALSGWYGLDGRVAVVTGGSGALGSAIARALAGAGARVALLGRRERPLLAIAHELAAAGAASDAIAVTADVLVAGELEAAAGAVLARWERIDILVNAAGGNVPGATLDDRQTVLDLPEQAFREVVELNLVGTMLPAQVFGTAILNGARARGEEPCGSIVNVSSMAASRAITRVAGYGAAKAALEGLTRSLAVELARSCGPGLRVNAIAPGFFVGEQNRRLLLAPDGEPTSRGRAIIERTPAGRFGDASELASTVVWLCGPGATFVTGVVVPVDGGFSAFAGV